MKIGQYNNSLVLGVCLLLVASLTSAAEPCRVFTDAKGRSVEGRLMEFNADQKTVTIQREDCQTFEASLEVFSEADQQYIRAQWFKDVVKVSAELTDFGNAKTFKHPRYKPENIECAGYAVLLENGSDLGLVDVDVEYCIYYRQYSGSEAQWMYTDGIYRGKIRASFVPAGAEQKMMTAPVMLYNEAMVMRPHGLSSGAEGQIRGIWIRAVATLPSGEKIKREFRDPADIGKGKGGGWPKTTVLAGLQAEIARQRAALKPAHKKGRRAVYFEWGKKSASR